MAMGKEMAMGTAKAREKGTETETAGRTETSEVLAMAVWVTAYS
jgi:hypothetical protein